MVTLQRSQPADLRLTLLTLGVTRASKDILLSVLLNLVPTRADDNGYDAQHRQAQGSLVDTEVHQLSHVFDNGQHCDLTVLDGPQLSDLYGSDMETAAIGSILQQVAQHGPVHAILLVADGSLNMLSSSDTLILSMLMDMLSKPAAASTLLAITNCATRQWEGAVPPGLSKRKLIPIPQTVFEIEPDRLELQPGEVSQLLHSWHDAFAAVRQVLHAASQQQPVDYQDLFKAHHMSSVGHPQSVLEQYSAHQAGLGLPTSASGSTQASQQAYPSFAPRPVRLDFESPSEQSGTANGLEPLIEDASSLSLSTPPLSMPKARTQPSQRSANGGSSRAAGRAAGPSPQTDMRQQAARLKAELRDGRSGAPVGTTSVGRTPERKAGGHFVPVNSGYTCHSTLVVPATQTFKIGSLFGAGGKVIDSIQRDTQSLITVPPRAQRQQGQDVSISISAAWDSHVQDAVAHISEALARG